MPEYLVTYPAGTLAKLVGEGKWSVSTTPRVETQSHPEGGSIEKAKQLFGENFFGEEAIHTFEEKCNGKGINVSFEIPRTPMHLDETQLELAKNEEAEGKERIVVLRPEWMVVDGEKKPVNILTLRDLFKQETVNPDDPNRTIISYDSNPFGEGPVFFKYEPDWYADQNFAKEQLKSGYAMPTKDVLPDSWSKTWEDQQELFGEGESRREANEAVWDLLLSYAVTGEKLLTQRADWTNSQASGERRGLVGWDSDGLHVHGWLPGNPYSFVGVCSSR